MQVKLNLKTLRELLPFCSKDLNRYICNGIRIIDKKIDDNGKIYRIYEASDGSIKARVMCEIKQIELKNSLILLASDIAKIDKKLKVDDVICDIYLDKNRAEIHNTIIEIIDGIYHATENLLPFSICKPSNYKQIQNYFYIRGNYIKMIEEFFNGGKLKLGSNFSEINAIMSKPLAKEGKNPPILFLNLIETYKAVLVIPIG